METIKEAFDLFFKKEFAKFYKDDLSKLSTYTEYQQLLEKEQNRHQQLLKQLTSELDDLRLHCEHETCTRHPMPNERGDDWCQCDICGTCWLTPL